MNRLGYKGIIRVLVFSAISTIVSLFFVELLLRTFAPVYVPGVEESYEYDPELGFHLRPSIHLLKTTDFQQEILVNHFGAVNFQESVQGYPKMLFALGDSYTQGIGNPADQAYPFQLDLILNRDGNGFYKKQFAVLNFGTGGFGGQESLLTLNRYSRMIRKPDCILYLGSDNDYEDDLIFESGYRHKHMVLNSPYWGKLTLPLWWLTYETQIGLRLKIAYTDYKKENLIQSANASSNKLPAEWEEPVLQKLLLYSKQNHARVILSWADRTPSYKWVKDWANKNGVAFADWQSRAESVSSSIPSLPLKNQHSGGHYRGWVNRIIAEEFARRVGDPSSNSD